MSGPLRVFIVDDEALARVRMKALLADIAGELPNVVVGEAANGVEALQKLAETPADAALVDIRMPQMDGVELARHLAGAERMPAVVFTTAYDQYAVQAFEAQAVDYLLKPVQPGRLDRTVHKLRQALQQRASPALEQTLAQLRELVQAPGVGGAAPSPAAPRLDVIQAGSGAQIHFVPVAEVLYFEAADKYVRVLTAEHEYLIRTPLKELAAQLDPAAFWQVHRGTLVRAGAIASAVRDEAGRLHLQLRGRPERLAVSRLYAHRFKGM